MPSGVLTIILSQTLIIFILAILLSYQIGKTRKLKRSQDK